MNKILNLFFPCSENAASEILIRIKSQIECILQKEIVYSHRDSGEFSLFEPFFTQVFSIYLV